MTETYYAIRIGIPSRHAPYLMIGEDRKTPLLFSTRQEAETRLEAQHGAHQKVIRVQITARRHTMKPATRGK